jgi:hypothetical protein
MGVKRRVNGALRAFTGIACTAVRVLFDRRPLILVASPSIVHQARWVSAWRRPHPVTGFASAEMTGDLIHGRLPGKCGETPRLRRRGTLIQAKGA